MDIEKYKGYVNYINSHPIKFAESIAGKLTLYQKLQVLFEHWKIKIKEKLL